jgi:hypothetical protein
LQPTPACVTV